MVYQQIDKIKQEYTDKYVVVDANRPELARFSDSVGQVKTVNMSGRALVEFGDYHKNIAWYDIDLDYLKVVDKPAPQDKKAAAKKPAAKPAAKKATGGTEKKLSPLEMARMQDAGSKPAASKPVTKAKPSTADILAAARGGTPAAKSEPKAVAPAKKTDRSKMSVADMLAAARGETSGPAKQEKAAEPAAEPEPAAKTAPAESAGDVVKVDRAAMSVDQMIAYCREKDSQ